MTRFSASPLHRLKTSAKLTYREINVVSRCERRSVVVYKDVLLRVLVEVHQPRVGRSSSGSAIDNVCGARANAPGASMPAYMCSSSRPLPVTRSCDQSPCRSPINTGGEEHAGAYGVEAWADPALGGWLAREGAVFHSVELYVQGDGLAGHRAHTIPKMPIATSLNNTSVWPSPSKSCISNDEYPDACNGARSGPCGLIVALALRAKVVPPAVAAPKCTWYVPR